MAENEPLTPEKQLLKLIENPKQGGVKEKAQQRKVKGLFSFGALRGRLAFWKAFSRKKVSSIRKEKAKAFHLKQLNLALKAMIAFLTLYFGYSVFVMAVELQKAQNLMFPKVEQLPVEKEEESGLKGLRHYLDRVGNR